MQSRPCSRARADLTVGGSCSGSPAITHASTPFTCNSRDVKTRIEYLAALLDWDEKLIWPRVASHDAYLHNHQLQGETIGGPVQGCLDFKIIVRYSIKFVTQAF